MKLHDNLILSRLLTLGAHFGHNKKLLDNTMIPYLLGSRDNLLLINLNKTLLNIKKVLMDEHSRTHLHVKII